MQIAHLTLCVKPVYNIKQAIELDIFGIIGSFTATEINDNSL